VAWRVCVRNGRSFPVQRWWAPSGCLGHIGRPAPGIPDHSARGTLYYGGLFAAALANHLEAPSGQIGALVAAARNFSCFGRICISVSFRGWQSWERESYSKFATCFFSERRAVAIGRLKHLAPWVAASFAGYFSKSLGLAHLRGNLSPEQSHAAAHCLSRMVRRCREFNSRAWRRPLNDSRPSGDWCCCMTLFWR